MAGTSPAVGSSTTSRAIRATTGTPLRSSGPTPRGQTPPRLHLLPLVPPSSIASVSFRKRSVGYSRAPRHHGPRGGRRHEDIVEPRGARVSDRGAAAGRTAPREA